MKIRKKTLFNMLSIASFLLGIFFILSNQILISGAVIGTEKTKSFSLILMLVFFIASFVLFGLAKKIHTHYYVEGAREATGSAVIIDTYRGSSLISTLLGIGADSIYPVMTPKEGREKAEQLRKNGIKVVLMGEKDQKTPKDFDFGNSLEDVLKNAERVKGATVVYVSTNAVAGIIEAKRSGKAKEVLIGSPVNRKSLVEFLKDAEDVSLIPVGESGRYAEEDMDYAQYLKQLLEGKQPNYEATRQKILKGKTAQLATKYNAEFDRDYALKLDQFDVVPKLEGDRIVDALRPQKSKR